MTGFYDEIKASSGMYKFYGNGEWKESTSGKGVSILNPTSNEAVYQVQGEEQCHLLHEPHSQHPKIQSVCVAAQMPRRPSLTCPCRGKRYLFVACMRRAVVLMEAERLMRLSGVPI